MCSIFQNYWFFYTSLLVIEEKEASSPSLIRMTLTMMIMAKLARLPADCARTRTGMILDTDVVAMPSGVQNVAIGTVTYCHTLTDFKNLLVIFPQ